MQPGNWSWHGVKIQAHGVIRHGCCWATGMWYAEITWNSVVNFDIRHKLTSLSEMVVTGAASSQVTKLQSPK